MTIEQSIRAIMPLLQTASHTEEEKQKHLKDMIDRWCLKSWYDGEEQTERACKDYPSSTYSDWWKSITEQEPNK